MLWKIGMAYLAFSFTASVAACYLGYRHRLLKERFYARA